MEINMHHRPCVPGTYFSMMLLVAPRCIPSYSTALRAKKEDGEQEDQSEVREVEDGVGK